MALSTLHDARGAATGAPRQRFGAMPVLPVRPAVRRPARAAPRASAPALTCVPLVVRAAAPSAPAAPAAPAAALAAPRPDKWAPVKAVVSRILKGAAVAGLAIALVSFGDGSSLDGASARAPARGGSGACAPAAGACMERAHRPPRDA